MLSQTIRRKFIEYFKEKGHAHIASSPVVPADDPTLLFTNAGMNQFKDVFLGSATRDYTSATTSQKCVRVGGKHNDLDNVGHTKRHLTFFEMLGNFSFGSYFKQEAIQYAWEVTLEIFQFDPKHLFATVFYEDDESFELWKNYLPESRIIRMGEKDNYWAMGDVGPCGPCSELHFDRGENFGKARSPAEDISGERFLEFWNLVFMEFNKGTNQEKYKLPKQCVDTGAGLERLVALKMGVDTVFETDILRTLIAQVEDLSKKHYQREAAFHVIADHIRSLAFAIADGVQPSNVDRGYVLRKVLRRAVRYGRRLDIHRPFLAELLPTLCELMGEDFPELVASQSRIAEILTLEEENFLRTLKRGGNLLQQIMTESKGQISGDNAFKLKDTYGLPLEEILLLAKDDNLSVDIDRFEMLEHEAKERSRKAHKGGEQIAHTSSFEEYVGRHGSCPFLGYRALTSEAVVLGIMRGENAVDALHPGEEGLVLLDQTPFYAEKGGQVGDHGTLGGRASLFKVIDTQAPYTDVVAHIGVMSEGELCVGDVITASVEPVRRQRIANNHTATHLLHWALQQILGPHIKQAGSVVEPDRLRFDFSHHKALTKEQISNVERLVNQKIRENTAVASYELSYDEAQKSPDIKQFFGDKYGATVRVIDIDFSKELCGGTHTNHLGTIGYFRIEKEGSIAAGVRRIEAVTGIEAELFAINTEQRLETVAHLLKTQPHKLEERVSKLLEENQALQKIAATMQKQAVQEEASQQLKNVTEIKGLSMLAITSTYGKELADLIMEQFAGVFVCITKQESRCAILIRMGADALEKGLFAKDLMQEIAPLLGGKGGGKKEAAQGGGTDLSKISEALQHATVWITAHIS